jgi:hypothetical protein
MAKPKNPLVIKVIDNQIIFFSRYEYSDFNRAVKPGKWNPEIISPATGGKPGAWVYPAHAEIAAKLLKSFKPVWDNEKDKQVDQAFLELAKSASPESLVTLKISIEDGRIVVRSDYLFRDILSSIPGRQWDNEKKAWTFPATSQYANLIHMTLTDQAIEDYTRAKKDPGYTELLLPEQEIEQNEIKSKLVGWQHQVDCFKRAWRHEGFMLAMEMGSGKSKVAVDLVVNHNCKLVLIATVKSAVSSVWPGEFKKYAECDYALLPLDMRNKTAPQKVEIAKDFIADCLAENKMCVLVLNYELAYQPAFQKFLLNQDIDAVICDESQKIQSAGSKISRFFARLGQRVKYRYCLTGTPMKSGPLSIYGQFRFLDPTIFGSNYQNFAERYAELDQYGRIVKLLNTEELHRKFYSRAFRVLTSDVLTLPEKVHVNLEFDLSRESRRIYDELETVFIAKVLEGTVTVSNSLVKLLRLQQAACGYLPVEGVADSTQLATVDTGKSDLLEDLLDGMEQGEPVVIFCRFTKDLDICHQVATKLGLTSMELSGRKNQLKEWKEGQAQVLAVQIQAGGAGIDLTRAKYVIYYSLGFSLDDYEQSLFRAWRPGQLRAIVVYHLLARDTVDIEIMNALVNKKKVIDSILTKRLDPNFNPYQPGQEQARANQLDQEYIIDLRTAEKA